MDPWDDHEVREEDLGRVLVWSRHINLHSVARKNVLVCLLVDYNMVSYLVIISSLIDINNFCEYAATALEGCSRVSNGRA